MHYLLSFGALPINAKEEIEAFDENSDQQFKGLIDDIYKIMILTFERSELVKKIKYKKIQNGFASHPYCFEGKKVILSFIDPIIIYFEVDKEEHEIVEHFGQSFYGDNTTNLNSSEKFNVVYNGFCYAYYRKISNSYSVYPSPVNARDIVENILKHDLRIVHASPVPLRSEFIINTKGSKSLKKEIKIELDSDNNIIIQCKNDIKNIDTFVKYLFRNLTRALSYFYCFTNQYTDFRFLYGDMERICDNIIKERSKIFLTSKYKVIKRKRIYNKIIMLIHDFYEKFNLFSQIKNYLENNIHHLERIIPIEFQLLSNELLNEFNLLEKPLEINFSLVELAQRDIIENKNQMSFWITIITSFISAIIGGVIGVLFSK